MVSDPQTPVYDDISTNNCMICPECRITRKMNLARIVCMIFAWRCHVCPNCKTVVFDSRVHQIGFRLTKPSFKGEVWIVREGMSHPG